MYAISEVFCTSKTNVYLNNSVKMLAFAQLYLETFYPVAEEINQLYVEDFYNDIGR